MNLETFAPLIKSHMRENGIKSFVLTLDEKEKNGFSITSLSYDIVKKEKALHELAKKSIKQLEVLKNGK